MRSHNKVLTPVDGSQLVADHNFPIAGLVPSVTLWGKNDKVNNVNEADNDMVETAGTDSVCGSDSSRTGSCSGEGHLVTVVVMAAEGPFIIS